MNYISDSFEKLIKSLLLVPPSKNILKEEFFCLFETII